MPTSIYRNNAGKRLPGVTTVIGNLGWNRDALVGWVRKEARTHIENHVEALMHRPIDANILAEWQRDILAFDPYRQRDDAADAGTLCHAWIAWTLPDITRTARSRPPWDDPSCDVDTTALPDDVIAKAQRGYQSFVQWQRFNQLTPIHLEEPLVSEELQVGGTPDCVGTLHGAMGLIDYKVTKGLYAEHLLQVAGYGLLLKEHGIELPGGYHILRLDKTTAAFHHHHWDRLDEAEQVFRALRRIHELKSTLQGLV